MQSLLLFQCEVLRVYLHRGFSDAAAIANTMRLDDFTALRRRSSSA